MDFSKISDTLIGFATTVGMKIALAILIWIVSFRLINLISRKLEKRLLSGKRHLDKTVVSTLFYAARIVLKTVVIICLIGYLGIDTSGITALIASLGVGVGLAVNGALSNLAGGAIILITRPFRVDDFIEAEGYSGTVEDIRMTNTRLRTPDNKVVYIPNGTLSTGTIVNYSEKDTRRVDFKFSIAYENDFELAKRIILDICTSHEKVIKDEANPPFVRVTAYGESSVELTARVWVESADFWAVKFDILESVKSELDKRGITIPYPQLDVHLKKDRRFSMKK